MTDPDVLAVADLRAMAAPYNPRTMDVHDMGALRRSLSTFGVVAPVVLNRRTRRIVGGHQRVLAAEAEGLLEALRRERELTQRIHDAVKELRDDDDSAARAS